MVDDAGILEALNRREDSKRTTEILLDKALQAGGKDNITIVLAGYSIPDLVAPPAPEERQEQDPRFIDTDELPEVGAPG
jgi:serine/threonine protein phosphatase PrpC